MLGQVPSSVTVVAALAGGQPRGLSIGTFAPVSLTPPLVGFFVAGTSSSWPPISATGSFAVSVLGNDQAAISSRFAVPGPGKFTGVSWHPAPSGHPVITGAVAWVDCEVTEQHVAGDHVLVLARVIDLGVEAGQDPLIHHRGGYRRTHDLEAASQPAPGQPDVATREPSP